MRRKAILVFLFLNVALTAASVFLFLRLDQVVHGDLYRYGLLFDYGWAGQYWTNSRNIMICLTISTSLTGASITFFSFYALTPLHKNDSMRIAISLVLIGGIVATAFSAYFFSRLDHVVHSDLYKYGLQFNDEWAVPYWTYARLILSSIGLQMAATTVTVALILGGLSISDTRRSIGVHTDFKPSSRKLISFVLFLAGSFALVFSVNYASKILAFIGLGLVLWGILLLYVVSDTYVAQECRKSHASKTPEELECSFR